MVPTYPWLMTVGSYSPLVGELSWNMARFGVTTQRGATHMPLRPARNFDVVVSQMLIRRKDET